MIKIIKRRLLKMNSSGFTLVEMIVATALLAVLLLAMMMFITPVFSNVKTNETDARANNVAAAMEYYLSRSIRDSIYVAVFENADYSDTQNGGTIYNDTNYQDMTNFLDKDDNDKVYNLNCISIRKSYDVREQSYKYIIYNEVLKSGDKCLDSTKSKAIFDICFYENLFPTVSMTQVSSTVTKDDGTTTTVLRPAYKTIVNIHNDAVINDSTLIFVGEGYVEFNNIKSSSVNPKGEYKAYPVTQVRTADEADAASLQTDTFIFYIQRKVK